MRMILRSLTILVLAVILLSACTTGKITPTKTAQTTSQPTSLPTPQIYGNPASDSCIQQGGTLSMQKRGQLGEYGVCVFEDTWQCEEWALLHGDCPVGGVDTSGYVTADGVFCVITGGEYTITGNAGATNEQGTCTFKTGKTCEAKAYSDGECNSKATTLPTFPPTDEPISNVVHLGVARADFSLRFDPLQWEVNAFDDDLPDLQMLAHPVLAGCRITPNIPVGLGEGWTTEEKQITVGQLELEVRSFYQNGTLKFVGYYNFLNPNGDGVVEVHFVDNSEACIQAAEALLAATEVVLP